VFKLIGQPVTEEYVLDRMGLDLKEDEAYLSGDYKAATDNLRSWTSIAVVKALAQELRLGATEAALYQRGLTEHVFHTQNARPNHDEDGYPVVYLENGEAMPAQGPQLEPGTVAQQRGQLMGSIVSFPVLCIVNAAICRWAMELAQGAVIPLRDARLMINGDDCAMRSKKRVYMFWRELAAAVGLEESVGKTYLSREFVDINSTSFRREEEAFDITTTGRDGNPRTRKTHLRQTRYINVGLILGLKRSGNKAGLSDQDDKESNISARAHELLRLAPPHAHEHVMRAFINVHREVLDKMRLPWYIPEWLGGVGLPAGPWGKPSDLDLRIARRILINWKTTRPIPLSHGELTWKTWLLAQQALPTPYYTDRKDNSTAAYTRAVAQKCIDLLFDSNISKDELYQAVQGFDASKAIAKNAKLWKVAEGSKKKANLPPPLEHDEVKFTALYPTWITSTTPSILKQNKNEQKTSKQEYHAEHHEGALD